MAEHTTNSGGLVPQADGGSPENHAESPRSPSAMSERSRGRSNAWMVLKVIEVRLRFVAILIATFVGFVYWETLKNHWQRQTQPDGRVFAAVHAVLGERAAHWLWPHEGADAGTDSGTEYYCPMHPDVVRPGLDPGGVMPKCPICGMTLSQRKKREAVKLPDGVEASVQLSPERIRLARIRTEPVTYQPLVKEITTVGLVGFDESRISRIVTRSAGFIEKLHVDKTWGTVKQGDPLAEIYSPELALAAQELVIAKKAKDQGLADRVDTPREKLRRLGVDDREIEQVLRSEKPDARLLIRSPQTGHVVRKEVVRGAHVEAGATLFEVADLSVVWIEGEVFAKDIPFVRVGQTIEATIEGVPGRTFAGTVSLVHPHLETATRTNAIRFELENPNHELRPGAFATVRLATPLAEIEPFKTLAASSGSVKEGEVLAVPDAAVIDTGSKTVVYVEHEPGLFYRLAVELGPRAGGFYSVIRGVEPGDQVVAAAAFLVDAESKLDSGAAAAYVGASGGSATAKPGATSTTTRATASPAGTGLRKPGEKKPGMRTAAAAAKKPSAENLKNVKKLPPPDREAALSQRICPISGEPLGSMGVPHRLILKDQPVFLCCKGCEPEASREADQVLKKVAELKSSREKGSP